MPSAARRALLPFALHALAREVDRALGVVLHTSLDVPGLGLEALRLLELRAAAISVGAWLLAGLALWTGLALPRCRGQLRHLREALALEADSFTPLYLRPALTLVALCSVTADGAYPYAFTLPVALTQDWSMAQDAAAVAAIVALARIPWPRRLPAPSAPAVFVIAFAAYAWLAPPASRLLAAHTGNEPKYLRDAAAIASRGGLQLDGLANAFEIPAPLPVRTLLARAAAAAAAGSLETGRALLAGEGFRDPPVALAGHLTTRGRDGRPYDVLAPGPGLLLFPLLQADRALDLARGTPGRIDVTIAAWNALAAALLAVVFLMARSGAGSAGVASLVAFAAGLVPPLLFYSWQFYPEVPAALSLALALHLLLFRSPAGARAALWLGLVIAPLPWLHQKYVPLSLVVLGMGVLAVHRARRGALAIAAVLAPPLFSHWLFAVHNFTITGSVRPDALFRAHGRGGVSPDTLGQGALGLLFDGRYGLLPYVPIGILAIAGLMAPAAGAARLRRAWPAALVYFLTVAAADNWTGSISNLGRFLLPLVPLAAAFAAVLLAKAPRRDVRALVLMLAAWTGLITFALWKDPAARNDSALLLEHAVFADGRSYLPALWQSHWSDPGLLPRVALWVVLVGAVAFWLRRASVRRSEATPGRVLAVSAAVLLLSALVLERWPSPRRAPRYANTVRLRRGGDVFVSGDLRREGDGFRVGPGSVELLVRSQAPRPRLDVAITGDGMLRVAKLPALAPGGAFAVPLEEIRVFSGRRGLSEHLYRQRLRVERGEVVLSFPGVRPVLKRR